MLKFGASILSWIPPKWTAASGLYAIEKTAEAGFDLLEILLPCSMEFDSVTVKKQLAKNGIDAVCTLNLPTECHIPFYPENAVKLIKAALDKVAEMEGDLLGGVLHSAIGTFTGKPCTADERAIVKEVITEVATYAKQRAITIAIEPVNRYESYVFTCAEEVLDAIRSIEAGNLALHLDTFHMNIEESNFYDPIIKAESLLKHLHLTESDRGMLGEGNVHWEDLFRALSEINFSGNLVLENFSSEITELVGPTSLWRPSKYNAATLAQESLAFMRKQAHKWGLH
ncbi:MAG: xylose isomerase [Segetibacter sp.]|nr:xylose isomerase [Segetibacter sp.]